MREAIFHDWYGVLRTAVMSAASFLTLIVMLRASGKRTLSKMNVFDFIFVVSMGSILANTITDKHLPLLEGLTALGVLILLQVVISWSTARWRSLDRAINGEPTMVFRGGDFLARTMRRSRLTHDEVRAAIRAAGVPRIEDVDAVVLETDGTLTVVWAERSAGTSSLADVPGGRHPGGPQEVTGTE